MISEELMWDDLDDYNNQDELVEEIDWDDDTLLALDEELAAQGGDEVGLNFPHVNFDQED
jgi:hypothetical protein